MAKVKRTHKKFVCVYISPAGEKFLTTKMFRSTVCLRSRTMEVGLKGSFVSEYTHKTARVIDLN